MSFPKVPRLTAIIALALYLTIVPPAYSWAEVPECIKEGDIVASHIHVQLFIIEIVSLYRSLPIEPHFLSERLNLVVLPSNLGQEDCLREIHTHRKDSTLHIESTKIGRKLTLGDFFDLLKISNISLQNHDGTDPLVISGGLPVASPRTLEFKNETNIFIFRRLIETLNP